MQTQDPRAKTMRSVTVDRTPREGHVVELPTGLLYMNEFFGQRAVISEPRRVVVTGRDRDEFFWRNGQGRSCYARFALRSRA